MLRRCSIDTDPEDLPYKTVESPVIKIGDLVRFNAKIGEDSAWRSGWRAGKKVGVVTNVRWALIDWHVGRKESFVPKAPYYAVECVLYWNDGDTSNTSQGCLEVIGESR